MDPGRFSVAGRRPDAADAGGIQRDTRERRVLVGLLQRHVDGSAACLGRGGARVRQEPEPHAIAG